MKLEELIDKQTELVERYKKAKADEINYMPLTKPLADGHYNYDNEVFRKSHAEFGAICNDLWNLNEEFKKLLT